MLVGTLRNRFQGLQSTCSHHSMLDRRNDRQLAQYADLDAVLLVRAVQLHQADSHAAR